MILTGLEQLETLMGDHVCRHALTKHTIIIHYSHGHTGGVNEDTRGGRCHMKCKGLIRLNHRIINDVNADW